MALDIHQGFKRIFNVAYVKADGSPGEVEGLPVWSITPPETSIVTVSADGLSAEVVWNGTGDGAVLNISADGDLGTGVFPINVTETLNFVAPMGATAGTLTASEEIAI